MLLFSSQTSKAIHNIMLERSLSAFRNAIPDPNTKLKLVASYVETDQGTSRVVDVIPNMFFFIDCDLSYRPMNKQGRRATNADIDHVLRHRYDVVFSSFLVPCYFHSSKYSALREYLREAI